MLILMCLYTTLEKCYYGDWGVVVLAGDKTGHDLGRY